MSEVGTSLDPGFEETLFAALTQREADFNGTTVVDLHSDIRQATNSYANLLSFLYERGYLKADPYQSEQVVDKRALPKDEPLTGRERALDLTKRLEHYRTVLTFLGEEFQFAVASMTAGDISLFEQTFAFIHWGDLNENSSHPTTAALGGLVSSAQKTANEMSKKILSDAVLTIGKRLGDGAQRLKEIVTLRREFVKLEIRKRILVDIPDNTPIDGVISQVKSQWQEVFPDEPFSQALLLEIQAENDPQRGPAVRAALLETLNVETKEETSEKTTQSPKDFLIDGVRAIAACSAALEKMAEKLEGNVILLGRRGNAAGALIQNLITSIFGKSDKEQPVSISIKDGDRGSQRNETIMLSTYLSGIQTKAGVYAGLLARSGSTWQRVHNYPDDKLFDFLRREMEDISVILQRSRGLDDYFRKNILPANKNRIRGTNMEASVIQEHLLRASKKINDYNLLVK